MVLELKGSLRVVVSRLAAAPLGEHGPGVATGAFDDARAATLASVGAVGRAS